MKRIYRYIYIIVFVIPCILHAPINELFQFQQSLNKLTQFLGKPQIPPPPVKIPITEIQLNTYEDLKKVVNEADYAENTNALDKYEQNIMVTTAKYLLQEYFKEKTLSGKNADYIPFIAYMVQQVVDRYPDKNTFLHCVFLEDYPPQFDENILENEFLLIRALVHLGYQKIQLIPMYLWYSDYYRETVLPGKFKEWIQANVPQPLQNNIILQLAEKRENEYVYISSVKAGTLPKNNLFFMIQSSDYTIQKESKDALLKELPSIFKKFPNTNFLSFEQAQATNRIEIYLPYSPSDIFINTTIPNTKEKIDNLKQIINNAGIKDPLYQQNLINFLINNFYDSILGTEIARGRIGLKIELFFLDLIQHTAIDPTKPLAFRSLRMDPNMTQITDMSGTLEQVYNRYKRPT